jgi:predicted nucleic acid-binding protein
MARIVFDTDVVSYHRMGRLAVSYARLVEANRHCIAVATAGELWKGAQIQQWDGVRRAALDLWLAKEMILSTDLDAARVWGVITAGAQRRGRPRPLNDSWIAACCIEGGLPLLTLNRRDFAGFAEHDGLVLLDG